jgi:outer membrane protein assembly factor BamB
MRIILFVASVFLALTGTVAAQTAVNLSPGSGHPNLPVSVSGTGFGDFEAIDVYIDTVDTALLVSTSTGTFTGSVTIPASATPGTHYITAIGRHSGAAAQHSFDVTTKWAEFGFGAAHLGWNPYENVLSPSTVPGLGLLWAAATSAGGGTPAIVNGVAYVGTTGGVQALSTTTGAVIWSKLTTSAFYSSPAVSGNSVFIGSNNGVVYALKTGNGAALWSYSTGGSIFGSPVVSGGTVFIASFVGSGTSTVYALQATTGKVLWTYTPGDDFDGSPAVVNGVVYIGGFYLGKLYALNATTGALLWSFTTGGPVESTPAIADNVLYFGSDDNKVYALRTTGANRGQLLWSYATGGVIVDSIAVADGIVYAGSGDDNMYALNGHSGSVIWELKTGSLARSPSVANGVVYFTSEDGYLYAASAAYGSIIATAQVDFTYFGAPAIADGVLYVASYLSGTYAFAPQAGVDQVRRRLAPPPSTLHPDPRLTITR